MEMTRRGFFKLAGTAAVSAIALNLGGMGKMAKAKTSIKLI